MSRELLEIDAPIRSNIFIAIGSRFWIRFGFDSIMLPGDRFLCNPEAALFKLRLGFFYIYASVLEISKGFFLAVDSFILLLMVSTWKTNGWHSITIWNWIIITLYCVGFYIPNVGLFGAIRLEEYFRQQKGVIHYIQKLKCW